MIPGLILWQALRFFLGENFGMAVILGGNRVFERTLCLLFVSSGSNVRRVGVAGEAPNFICRIFDDTGSNPCSAFSVVSLDTVKSGRRGVGGSSVRATRYFHFSHDPVNLWVDAFQPG